MTRISISNMKCNGCVANAKQALQDLPGLESVEIEAFEMDSIGIWILISVLALLLGGVAGYFVRNYLTQQANQRMKSEGERFLSEAREKASATELEARDQAIAIRQEAEKETQRRRNELSKEEDRLQRRRDRAV